MHTLTIFDYPSQIIAAFENVEYGTSPHHINLPGHISNIFTLHQINLRFKPTNLQFNYVAYIVMISNIELDPAETYPRIHHYYNEQYLLLAMRRVY